MRSSVRKLFVCSVCLLCLAVGTYGDETATDEAAEPGFFGFYFDIEDEGVRVTDLWEESPAAAAGLKPGDRIVSVDGTDLQGMSHFDLHEFLAPYRAGDRATMGVIRGGKYLVAQLSLTPKPQELRVTPEEMERHRRLIEDDEAIETVLRLVGRSEFLLILRTTEGEIVVKPMVEGASWTVATPALTKILHRASYGAVSPLKPGEALEVKAILGDNSLELEVRRKLREPESSGSQ